MTNQWDVVRDTMAAFQSEILLRVHDGWTLHSWHPFIVMLGGGRIAPYPEHMICSVWTRVSAGKDSPND